MIANGEVFSGKSSNPGGFGILSAVVWRRRSKVATTGVSGKSPTPTPIIAFLFVVAGN